MLRGPVVTYVPAAAGDSCAFFCNVSGRWMQQEAPSRAPNPARAGAARVYTHTHFLSLSSSLARTHTHTALGSRKAVDLFFFILLFKAVGGSPAGFVPHAHDACSGRALKGSAPVCTPARAGPGWERPRRSSSRSRARRPGSSVRFQASLINVYLRSWTPEWGFNPRYLVHLLHAWWAWFRTLDWVSCSVF